MLQPGDKTRRIGNLEIFHADYYSRLSWEQANKYIDERLGNGWRLPTEGEMRFFLLCHGEKIGLFKALDEYNSYYAISDPNWVFSTFTYEFYEPISKEMNLVLRFVRDAI